MSLQDFFTSARLHRMQKNFFTEECSTLFVLLKSNQYYWSRKNHQYRKTVLSMIDFVDFVQFMNVLRHNTYIIVSCKNMKKIKNGTWLPWKPGKTPKKQAKLCLCRSKYLRKGKWYKIEFFISFLNDMEL